MCKIWNMRSIDCSYKMRNPTWVSNYCFKILNRVRLGNCIKIRCKWVLTNINNFLITYEFYFQPSHIHPTIDKIISVSSLCNDIATLLSTGNVSFICVLFVYKYGPTSHEEIWMYYDTHNFFDWTFSSSKNPIIIYRWTLHFSQILTHYDHSSSYSQSKCSKSWHFLIVHRVPMLAYRAHVTQSRATTNIKPMQQDPFLFSQDDPSCYPFLPHRCKTQKMSEKEREWRYITTLHRYT
jgi:hypothetical protein